MSNKENYFEAELGASAWEELTKERSFACLECQESVTRWSICWHKTYGGSSKEEWLIFRSWREKL